MMFAFHCLVISLCQKLGSTVFMLTLSFSVGCNRLPQGGTNARQGPVAAAPSLSLLPTKSSPGGSEPLPLSVLLPESSCLAHLQSLRSRVTFRRSTEPVWREAFVDLSLHEWDAIQTHEHASAELSLDRGAFLNLSENTLLVVTPSISGKVEDADRAVLRKGFVRGKTAGEMWVLTSAALFHMRPSSRAEEAEVLLSVTEGEQLRVRMERGEGTLYVVGEKKEPRRMRLNLREDVTLSAPLVSPKFGFDSLITLWPEIGSTDATPISAPPLPKVAKTRSPAGISHKGVATQVARAAVDASAELNRPSLFVSFPPNYSEVNSESIELRGHTSSAHARVLVNGRPASIKPNREFASRISLSVGANRISIQSILPGGDTSFKEWIVLRRD